MNVAEALLRGHNVLTGPKVQNLLDDLAHMLVTSDTSAEEDILVLGKGLVELVEETAQFTPEQRAESFRKAFVLAKETERALDGRATHAEALIAWGLAIQHIALADKVTSDMETKP